MTPKQQLAPGTTIVRSHPENDAEVRVIQEVRPTGYTWEGLASINPGTFTTEETDPTDPLLQSDEWYVVTPEMLSQWQQNSWKPVKNQPLIFGLEDN